MTTNKDIKFSITIPAFKRKYLAEAIESCLVQTYHNFEVIIVDDCSPEDLRSVIEPYLKDKRVHFYRNKKNCGAFNVVDNWNICLGYATGDYVICMGDDDRLLPYCLAEYAKLTRKYPDIGAIHGWTEIIDEKSRFVDIAAQRPQWESALAVLWNRWNGRKHQFIGDWCFHREYLLSQGGYYKMPLAWGTDDITALIAASKAGVANTQHIVFQYRVNHLTISTTGKIDHKLDAMFVERQWFDMFLSKQPTTDLDSKYHQLLLNLLSKHYDKMYGLYISFALRKNIFSIFRYIHRRKHYGYTSKAIGYALYMWMKG